jgi:hypothetical protein
MFVSPAFSKPALLRRHDRRDRQRFPFPSSVTVDGRPAQGRDLSATGISVFVPVPQVGAVVQVAVPTVEGAGQAIETPARVVRLDRTPSGYIVGLEFLATENTGATDNTDNTERTGRANF